MSGTGSAEGAARLSLGWRLLHWAIILNLLAEFIYARWLVSKWVAGHRARGRAGSVFRDPRDIAHIPQRSREAEAAEIVREGP